MSENVTIIESINKSPFTAAALAFLFGPLGAFYTSISMGFISIFFCALAVGTGLLLGGIGTIVTVPIYYLLNTVLCYLSVKKQLKNNTKKLEDNITSMTNAA